MIDASKKKISEKPLLVFLLTLISLAMLLMIFAVFDEQSLSVVIGTYFLYGGIIVAVIGFLLLNKGGGHKWDGYNQSNYIKNDEYFRKVRAQERPFERIVWAVILAAISIATIGYLLNKFMD